MTTALDLFAGAGGWSLAAQRLGIDETGVEIMPEAVATRSAAGFKTHEVGDVWDIDYALLRGVYDGLIASPPCQTFSTAGKGAGRKALDDVLALIRSGAFKDIAALREGWGGDQRTALVLAPLHAAWEMRPEWIAWEQVPTVLPVWEACATELRSWGYSVWTGNLQAEMYGVPQTRKRAFLIAHREREVAPPVPTHSRYYSRNPEKLDDGVQKWVSMAEGLGWGLVQRPSYTVCGVSAHAKGDSEWGGASVRKALLSARNSGDPEVWHYGAGVTGLVQRRLGQPAATVTAKGTGYWGWGLSNRPAPTITGGGTEAGGAEPIAKLARYTSRPDWIPARDGKVRVTVAESGVLQSFPADFPWQGRTESCRYLQSGNAVPPLLAEAVLRAAVGLEPSDSQTAYAAASV